MNPEELAAAGIPDIIGARIKLAPGVDWTCRVGLRILDYALVSRGMAILQTLGVDSDVPWSPHLGIAAGISPRPRSVMIRVVSSQARRCGSYQVGSPARHPTAMEH